MRVLGINAIFHDPAAALVVDGRVVAAAEEERFSRRKHGKRPVAFSAWELPELSAAWCLRQAGIDAASLDAVAYSFDPGLCRDAAELGLTDPWDWLRIEYAKRAPQFLAEVLPGLDPEIVRFVPHHVAHAASAGLAVPPDPTGTTGSAVLVLDGRGETASHLGGVYREGRLRQLAAQQLPHSLGLLYEDLTRHLGFLHSSDEYKVMALASYGEPRHLGLLRELVRVTDDGGFTVDRIDWASLAKPRPPDAEMTGEHADLAASVQARLEEVILDLARWLHEAADGPTTLTMAGGVALNCVANARIAAEGPYQRVWVQPAAGDAGTALGAALHLDSVLGDTTAPMPGVDLGRGWTDEELEAELRRAALPYRRPDSIAAEAARVLADNGIVAWFQGRSEYGPRALGHRSLLAHPGDPETTRRMNDVKGREQFRPIAPMVRAERAAEIFDGVLPSPYMLFVHRVAPQWRDRIPAVVHVDGTARVQTVDPGTEPLVAEMLAEFDRLTGLPVVVNTSLNTAGRPMVDTPREAMELFGSAPVDLLAIGPYAVHRGDLGAGR
ncbi:MULTISPECIES: carbamoyltransferase C-terminal domain-containing protein [unclassified Plantactinospora]|uniref:carbamoyltransferase family protein n=1 Tax=unclassified Plantactinospora TaxID=2631981 RepID=UPI000D15CAD7|nr:MULTISPECIES: carbamoyltransferase C-terminal domain-containing protein [unclassified Plantactinospora]AVT29371.1 carbamoyltransferase [Plantactinospora sp. BC1]AVT35785.1 carbamoyltransferase [Plantactinospora sp. BB1]